MADCCLKLKERMGSLTIKEQQVATFILDYPEEVINMSINDLADSCGVSVSSVVRLCKSIGYSGYKELCRMLSADLLMNQQESVTYEDVRPGDSIEAIMRSVCLADMKAIESTMSLINVAALQRAVEAISKAQRVDFYGVGTSGYVAMDARNKFLRINKVSMPSADSHDQILCAATLKPDDVAVAISYTGDTKDILEAVGIIKRTGATLISITRYNKNPLAQQSDLQLYTASPETMVRSGAMGSRIALLAVIDVLYTCTASRNYEDVKKSLDKSRLITARKHMQLN
jgi:DNA-binding MurR/RpiR family transcriptional regulator